MNLPVQPQPVEYRIIKGTDAALVAQEVNAALKEGFILHGPTTVVIPHSVNYPTYVQPVARIEMVPVKLGRLESAENTLTVPPMPILRA